MNHYVFPGIVYEEPTTFDHIESVVTDFYSITLETLRDPTRRHSREVSYCRFLVGFFAIEFMSATLVSIADRLDCHHSTVIYGRRMVQNRIHTEQFFCAEVGEMRKRIIDMRYVGKVGAMLETT